MMRGKLSRNKLDSGGIFRVAGVAAAACCFCVASIAAFIAAPVAHATQVRQPEYSQFDVEAVYLYDFAKFVRWPDGAPGVPLTICIYGDSPITGVLHRLVVNETIDGRPLAVTAIHDALAAQSCSIVFLPESEQASRDPLLAGLRGKPILTVSDTSGFMKDGGIIQFVIHEGRVRFSVNLAAADKGRMRISSELLKVALSVKGKPLPEEPR